MTTEKEQDRICKLRDAMDKAAGTMHAWVLLKDGRAAGRVAIKHGARVKAWVYVDGLGWRAGSAGGYGYDKAGAAMARAVPELVKDEGASWEDDMRAAGYDVEQAI